VSTVDGTLVTRVRPFSTECLLLRIRRLSRLHPSGQLRVSTPVITRQTIHESSSAAIPRLCHCNKEVPTMKALLAYARLIDAVNDKFGAIAKWAVILSCLISATNAIVRYSASYSSNAFLEIQWYLFAACVML